MPWRSFTWTRRAHKNWRKLQKVAGHRYLEPMQLRLQDFKIWRKLGHQAFSTGAIRCQVSCGVAPLTLMMTLIATARMETSQSVIFRIDEHVERLEFRMDGKFAAVENVAALFLGQTGVDIHSRVRIRRLCPRLFIQDNYQDRCTLAEPEETAPQESEDSEGRRRRPWPNGPLAPADLGPGPWVRDGRVV